MLKSRSCLGISGTTSWGKKLRFWCRNDFGTNTPNTARSSSTSLECGRWVKVCSCTDDGKTETEFPVEISLSPLETEEGTLVSGAVRDVTERKRAEEERERLRQVQADLAHLSRVTTMGELTASLAHEIKQPIAAAVTNAKTCLRWLGREQPDVAEAREAAARLIKDVTRASDIISSISLLFKKGGVQRGWLM